MSDNDLEKIPALNELMDEVFEDVNAFAIDITSSISLMPLAVFGVICLTGITYWFYFHLLKSETLFNRIIAWAAIGLLLYLSVILLLRYFKMKRKYSQLFYSAY